MTDPDQVPVPAGGKPFDFNSAVEKAKAIAAKLSQGANSDIPDDPGSLVGKRPHSEVDDYKPPSSGYRREDYQPDAKRPSTDYSDNGNQYGGNSRPRYGLGHNDGPTGGGGAGHYGPGPTSGGAVSEEMSVPAEFVGLIIGRMGENMKMIERNCNVRVQFAPASGNESERRTTITGAPQDVAEAKGMIMDQINRGPGPGPRSSAPSSMYQPPQNNSENMSIPAHQVGLVIGRRGETIHSLQDRSGARITVTPEGPGDLSSGMRTIQLTGAPASISEARALIEDLVNQPGPGRGGPMMGGGPGMMMGPAEIIKVHTERVGLVIGRGGEVVKAIQAQCEVRIKIDSQADEEGNRTVIITGPPDNVAQAKELVMERVNGRRDPGYGPQGGGFGGGGGYQQGGYGGPGGPGGAPYGGGGYQQPPYGGGGGYDYQQQQPQQQPVAGGYGMYDQQQQQQPGADGQYAAPEDQEAAWRTYYQQYYDYYGQYPADMQPGFMDNVAGAAGGASAPGVASTAPGAPTGVPQEQQLPEQQQLQEQAEPQQSHQQPPEKQEDQKPEESEAQPPTTSEEGPHAKEPSSHETTDDHKPEALAVTNGAGSVESPETEDNAETLPSPPPSPLDLEKAQNNAAQQQAHVGAAAVAAVAPAAGSDSREKQVCPLPDEGYTSWKNTASSPIEQQVLGCGLDENYLADLAHHSSSADEYMASLDDGFGAHVTAQSTSGASTVGASTTAAVEEYVSMPSLPHTAKVRHHEFEWNSMANWHYNVAAAAAEHSPYPMPNPCPVAHHDVAMQSPIAVESLSHEQHHMTTEEHAAMEQQILASEHAMSHQGQMVEHSVVDNVAMFSAADHVFFMPRSDSEQQVSRYQQQQQQQQDHHEMLMYLSKDQFSNFNGGNHPAPPTYMDLDVLGGQESGMYGALSLGLDPMDFSSMDLTTTTTTAEQNEHAMHADPAAFFEHNQHHHHSHHGQQSDMLDMYENASVMSTCPSDRPAAEGEDFFIHFDHQHYERHNQLASAAGDQFVFPALDCQGFSPMQQSLQPQQQEIELDSHGVPVHLVSLADIETAPASQPRPPRSDQLQVDRLSQLRNSKSYPPPLHFKSKKALENMGVHLAPEGVAPGDIQAASLSSMASPSSSAGSRLEHPADDVGMDVKNESGSEYEPEQVKPVQPLSKYKLKDEISWKLSTPVTAFDKLIFKPTRDDDVESPVTPMSALLPAKENPSPRKKISDASLVTTATASSFGESIASAEPDSSPHWDAATARCSDTQTVYLFVNETSKIADMPVPDDPETNPAAFASEDGFKCVCGKLFKKLYNLKNHYKMHAVDKPYICDVCQRGFMRKHDLKRHATTHLQDFRPYECEDCHTPFTRLDALHRHIRARRCRAV
ncbi:RNA binding protein, heterogenous nuclear RNP-K like protein [Geranomyces variabilis]|nr:RNA binding protein, heterogenous nuclear RNP-K like protein [Geranomyces variabilis]